MTTRERLLLAGAGMAAERFWDQLTRRATGRDLIRDAADVAAFRDDVLFGPAFCRPDAQREAA